MSSLYEKKGYGILSMCNLLGYTKQAYYKHVKLSGSEAVRYDVILQAIYSIRENQPDLSVKKVYVLLKGYLPPDLVIGRDATYDLMRLHGLVHPQRRYRIRTTLTVYRLEYHDLIKDLVIDHPNQVWVADITYIRIVTGDFIYLSLLTDAYSRRIMGWNLSVSLALEGALDALRMALSVLPPDFFPIHHSDRGCQYYSKAYTGLLKSRGLQISMYTDGDPRHNAIAERINGTIKNEMLAGKEICSFEEGQVIIAEAIRLYNHERPHLSLDYKTPDEAYRMKGLIKRRWKATYKKKEVDGDL